MNTPETATRRTRQRRSVVTAIAVAFALLTAACGGDDDAATAGATTGATQDGTSTGASSAPGDTAGGETGSSTAATSSATDDDDTVTDDDETAPAGESLLRDDGPCDASLDPYPVGNTLIVASPTLSAGEQQIALDASINAFNDRGGIGGHCMELHACDSRGDPATEIACVRQLVDDGVVVTLSDSLAVAPADSTEIIDDAGVPRIGMNPASAELESPNTFAFTGGGQASILLTPAICANSGHTKIAAIHFDAPAAASLFDAMQPLLDAHGAEIVARIPVPAGTTDFQQFTLAAESAGATCVTLGLGENEAVQVLRAAEQLGTDMEFAGSLSTFSLASLESFGDFAGRLRFIADMPPITASQERWPILGDIIADFESDGRSELATENVKVNQLRSWLATYSLVRIVEDFGDPDTVTREAVLAALHAAKDVDMFGLVPRWTPSATAENSPWPALSQPWSYQASFDPDAGEWTIADDLIHYTNEISGIVDYEQPTG